MEYEINEKLVEQQGLTEERKIAIQEVGDVMMRFLKRPEMYVQHDQVVEMVKSFEYTLQMLWNFDPDSTKHKYWNHLAACECPFADNLELFGTDYRIFNQNCPYHGEGF